MSAQTEKPDWNMLAAEYVLRVMPAEEETAFEERMMRDNRLHKIVAYWVEQFRGLDSEFGEAAPRPRAKKALMTKLFEDPTRDKVPFWQRLWMWQGISVAALALAGFVTFQAVQPVGAPTSAVLAVGASHEI